MPSRDELEVLINKRLRYLRKLKEQKAALGILTPPAIDIDIEDTEEEIEDLQAQLETLKDDETGKDIQPNLDELDVGGGLKLEPRRELLISPFTPYDIATKESFTGRAEEIEQVLKHMLAGKNSCIVGNPHIGKSSLLRRISDPDLATQFSFQSNRYIFVEVDFQSFISDNNPEDFWAYVLEEIISNEPEVKDLFKPLLENKTYDARRLQKPFIHLERDQRRVVLLADEFDHLVNNQPHFLTPDFMHSLYILAGRTNGLILVTTSRLAVDQLHNRVKFQNAMRDFALFNHLEEIPLGTLRLVDVEKWLRQYFKSPEVIEEISLLAGNHPLLLQLAGDIYFEADRSDDIARRELLSTFMRRAESQFHDVWDYLEPKAQIALVIFILDFLRVELALGEKFDLDKVIEQLVWYPKEVRNMVRSGTLEMGSEGQYQPGSKAFLLWIVEDKIIGKWENDSLNAFVEWLANKQFKVNGISTPEEIVWLHDVWQTIPDNLITLVRQVIFPKGWL